MIGSGKHSSLLQYGNNYCRKKFYSTGPWLLRSDEKEKMPMKLTPLICVCFLCGSDIIRNVSYLCAFLMTIVFNEVLLSFSLSGYHITSYNQNYSVGA